MSSLQGLGECCSILVCGQQFFDFCQIGNLEFHLSLLSQAAMTAYEVLGTRFERLLCLGQLSIYGSCICHLQRTHMSLGRCPVGVIDLLLSDDDGIPGEVGSGAMLEVEVHTAQLRVSPKGTSAAVCVGSSTMVSPN